MLFPLIYHKLGKVFSNQEEEKKEGGGGDKGMVFAAMRGFMEEGLMMAAFIWYRRATKKRVNILFSYTFLKLMKLHAANTTLIQEERIFRQKFWCFVSALVKLLGLYEKSVELSMSMYEASLFSVSLEFHNWLLNLPWKLILF